jgi:rhodanese-related sulfurtransferase/rubrerythrin
LTFLRFYPKNLKKLKCPSIYLAIQQETQKESAMRWKQFFTPVESINADQAKEFMSEKKTDQITILDVRQAKEYEAGHIPGATLIPLPDLSERLAEIEPDKSTIVYCASGGRSRIAAQMIAGKGFGDVYNLAGGFKAWNSKAAYGMEDLGLELFTGEETSEKALAIAYSLEHGLRDFYLSMVPKVKNDNAKTLFQKLSAIEIKHQDRIYEIYVNLSDRPSSREEFEESTVANVIEGGLTTEEYIRLFQPDLDSVEDIIALAMSIEAQALDLYQRASRKSRDPQSKEAFMQIADEENAHLAQLGKLMDNL